jgi:hypothetical protein
VSTACVAVSIPPAMVYVVFTSGGGLPQSERMMDDSTERTFDHVVVVEAE